VRTEETLAWKVWIFSTRLESLDVQCEDEVLLETRGRKLDRRVHVGGGNATLTLAARLKALGVDSILAERNTNVGDNWALRYDSLKFHLPTSSCELPYITYDKELQSAHQLSRNDLAEQMRRYVAAFNLNAITSAEITQTTQMPDKRW
jgi:cation diffusion facilitator CzcD-associated flavoprotein CzcO